MHIESQLIKFFDKKNKIFARILFLEHHAERVLVARINQLKIYFDLLPRILISSTYLDNLSRSRAVEGRTQQVYIIM